MCDVHTLPQGDLVTDGHLSPPEYMCGRLWEKKNGRVAPYPQPSSAQRAFSALCSVAWDPSLSPSCCPEGQRDKRVV